MGRFGSRTSEIQRLLGELAAASWYAPRDLGPGEIQARVDEHLDRMPPMLAPGVPVRRRPVIVERSFEALVERWTTAWTAEDAESGDPAYLHFLALEHSMWFRLVATAEVEQGARIAIDDALAAVALALDARHPSLPNGFLLAAQHILWLLDGERDPARDPVAPLLALALRGAWPVVLPGWQIVVYLPDGVTSWRTVQRSAMWGSAALPLDALGLSPVQWPRVMPAATLTWRDRTTALSAIHRIGRSAGMDTRVEDDSCSRQHAVIVWAGDGFWIRDLRSACGIYDARNRPNGRSGPLRLDPGDRIGVGNPQRAEIRIAIDDSATRVATFGLVSRAPTAEAWQRPPRPVAEPAVLAELEAIAPVGPMDPAQWLMPCEPSPARIERAWLLHLQRLAPGRTLSPTIDCEPSLIAAWTHWNDAWVATERRHYDPAWYWHLHALEQYVHAIELACNAADANALGNLLRRLSPVVAGAPGASRVAPFLRAHWGSPELPIKQLAALVLVECDPESPLVPLLELWSLGVWPMAMPGGDVVVWIPQRDRDGLPILNLEEADIPAKHKHGPWETLDGPHFLVDRMHDSPVMPHQHRERWYGVARGMLAPRGTPPPAHLRIIDQHGHGDATIGLGAETRLALGEADRPRWTGRSTLSSPDDATIVYRDHAFWLTNMERQSPAIGVNGAWKLGGHRPLVHGDTLHHCGRILRLELSGLR